tara:strand:+ start:13818 stop:15143 length:1326 start_codon:yes stop_codon:yes gene_type:complete
MANLVELSQMAEDMPDEQLIQATQGQGNFPPFVAIQEVKRRTDLRKAYEAQQPKPQASVSEKLVAEFANSPSGLGAMNQPPDLQQAFPSGDMGNMAPPSPMQMMAGGGRTGYMAGGALPYPKPKTKFQAAGEYLFDIASDVGQWAKNNPVDAVALGLTFVPGVGIALRGGKLALDAVNKAVKGKNVIKSMYSKPVTLERVNKTQDLGDAAKSLGFADDVMKYGRQFDYKRYVGSLAGGYGTYKGVEYGMSPAANQDIATIPIGMGENKLNFNLDPSKFGIAGFKGPVETNEGDALSKVEKDSDKGLTKLREFATSPDNADLLIGLGGAISSARNLGELGSGISDAYRGVMADRAAVKQAGLQGRLLEAQISKIELEVANMPLNIAIKQYESLNDLVDSGVLTAEEAKIREIALSKRIQELQGITADQKSERDELLGLTKVV